MIIVGFGRFGQIVGRLLFASGIRATVLDHDPDNIEVLRRLGFRVFYGDGTRLDLLTVRRRRAAPACWSTPSTTWTSNLKLIDVAQQYFPDLRIVARARNVTHWRELRERGVAHASSARRSSRRCAPAAAPSRRSACAPHEARERADLFRRHNLADARGAAARGLGRRSAAHLAARARRASSSSSSSRRTRRSSSRRSATAGTVRTRTDEHRGRAGLPRLAYRRRAPDRLEPERSEHWAMVVTLHNG